MALHQVRDHLIQSLAFGTDDREEFPLGFGIRVRVIQEDLRKRPDRGQGGSEVVGHLGQEPVLHTGQLPVPCHVAKEPQGPDRLAPFILDPRAAHLKQDSVPVGPEDLLFLVMGVGVVNPAFRASLPVRPCLPFGGWGGMTLGAVLLCPAIGEELSPQGTILVFASHGLPASQVFGLLVVKDPGEPRPLVEHGLEGFPDPFLGVDGQQEFRHRVHPSERRGRIREDDSLGEGVEQGLDFMSIEHLLHVGVPFTRYTPYTPHADLQNCASSKGGGLSEASRPLPPVRFFFAGVGSQCRTISSWMASRR